ncbi:MAG: FAD-dependent oxidoreductase [Clostridiales bacterium]|nr:FAD-dependent oxidoreductase [Clostridiales bacterium]
MPDSIKSKWGSWAIPPDPVRADEIKETLYADIVVLGAGIAGVSCALRAAQCGANVLVLEKSGSWSGRGGNIGVANSSYMKSCGIENDITEIAREWIKRCGNRCDEKLVWQFLKNSGRAMDWLTDILAQPAYGARPALQGCAYRGETYRENYGSHRFFGGPMEKKGMRAGGADAVFAMYSEAVKLGTRFLFKTPAEQLLKENGRVTGVYARRETGDYLLVIAQRGIILATGDIAGNDEMCEDLAPLANRCAVKLYFPKGVNKGDGHRMGLWAGGSFEDAPFAAMIHPQAFHPSNFCFLYVNQDGSRFMNEDNYIQGRCLAILRERITYAWSIVDSAWREKLPETLRCGGGIAWGQDFEVGEPEFDLAKEEKSFERGIERGLIVTADTPEELAGKMGVPADEFVSTLTRYNTLAVSGYDEDFGKRKEMMIPLEKPPYYGVKIGPALLAVVGGLRVDCQMRVLDDDNMPISGLYAIGNTAGGRYGTDYPMVIHGTSHGTALTFGYLLGEQLGNI